MSLDNYSPIIGDLYSRFYTIDKDGPQIEICPWQVEVILDEDGDITNKETLDLEEEQYEACFHEFAQTLNTYPEISKILDIIIYSGNLSECVSKRFENTTVEMVIDFMELTTQCWRSHVESYLRGEIVEVRSGQKGSLILSQVKSMSRKAKNLLEDRTEIVTSTNNAKILNSVNYLLGPAGFSLQHAVKQPESWEGFSLKELVDNMPSYSINELAYLVNSLNEYIKTVNTTAKFKDAFLYPNSGLSIATTVRTLANIEIERRQSEEG